MATTTLPNPPRELIDAFLRGEVVLFAGSGLSVQAGLPTWNELVTRLVQRMAANDGIDRDLIDSWAESVREGEYSAVTDSIVLTTWPNPELRRQVIEALKDLVTRNPLYAIEPISECHSLLRRLPFAAALTTNFDHLLELTFDDRTAHVFTPLDADAIKTAVARAGDLSSAGLFILKLYGGLQDERSCLISRQQFHEMVSRNAAFEEAMNAILSSHTLFFFGTSIDGIEAYFSALRLTPTSHKHYALLDMRGKGLRTRAQSLRQRYNIEVIGYEPSSNFKEFAEFLKSIVEQVEAQRYPVVPSREGQPIRRLLLENTGSFTNLDLSFDELHTVLLGSNGTGKTTILRSIARALIGESYAEGGSRLLRAGSMVGRIEVVPTTGQHVVASLKRQSDGSVELQSIPRLPLDTQSVPLFGFPSLRSAAVWFPEQWTIAGPGRPAVADLAPIANGDSEPRAKDVTQWLLDLELKISTEPRFNQLRDGYFEVLQELLDGVVLRFDSVNPDTKQVMVRTADAVVPITMVSQGMSSMLSWLSIFMRRLADIYQTSEDLGDYTNREAVVLLDEIDAHLHPRWQRTVLTKFRRLFPKTQLIVTTHSPLVISDLRKESVWILRREDGPSGPVSAVRPSVDPRSMRTEEILTDPLFDLDTVWGPDTYDRAQEYRDLLSRSVADSDEPLSTDEEVRLAELSAEFSQPAPTKQQRSKAKQVADLIEGLAKKQLDAMDVGEKEELLAELRLQMLQDVAGTAVPEIEQDAS